MAKIAKNSGMWAYLDASGVLENGTEEDIKAAKKAYRKLYHLNYIRKIRASKPEFTVNLSKDNGEYSRILSAAKAHGRKVPSFLRMAALAYISKTYIVPDRLVVARLEQMLSQCLNEIQLIIKQKENYFWGKEQKFKDIEKRIEKLESEISKAFEQPKILEELVIKEVHEKPAFKEQLITILSNLP
jgi:hypothetical protein